MARQPKLSKADAIRQHMADNPDASPSETAEALRKAGYKGMTPQYVSTIKSMDKRKSSGPNRRGPLMAEDLLAAREFVRNLGGVSRANEAIQHLERLGV
ncbi:hypothetical protein [Blastopirellula marina]|uniref:Uncharacterized protein n=1 Tax=Blastopirellula marina TaxID=124 RepID=A0A2S8F856_9BACT|nr:hypothetical protein [Blastopirellula marina]PQO28114.1 hypothetical protein C5Y98_24720 [Blastopirellula marina]PTL41654.1 hypothetical protein C5Y97_24735 [Blastopirellula marina]